MTIHAGRRAVALASAAALSSLLSVSPASAQGTTSGRSTLFDQARVADPALDAQQAAKLAQYRAERVASVTIVRVATDRLTHPDPIDLVLGAGTPVALERRGLTERGPRAFTWHGRGPAPLGVNPRDVSDATLVVNGDSVVGTIRSGGEVYQIRPLGGGLSALIRLDSNRMPPEHPPGFDRQPVAPAQDGQQRDGALGDDDCGTYNLLVAYTASAKAQAGDIDSLIQLAIDETNQGYAASGVATRVNIVHRYQTGYTDSGDLGTDLNRFTAKGDGFADEMHGLRDQYAADVAVLLTGRSNYCGVAWLYPGAESAFGVVAQDCATGYYSFAHEIGHIQGARHNPQIDAGTTPFAYGHGFYYEPSRWRTIMSYDCPSGCARLNNWSNPTKTRDGVPLGTSAVSDNTRALNTSACRVANFRIGGGGGGGGGMPSWHDWETLTADVAAPPECLATGDSQIDCWVARSSSRIAWSSWNGTAWSAWADLGGATANPPSCIPTAAGLTCFIVASSGELQQSTFAGSGWSGWVSRGGSLRGQPSCLAVGSTTECFAQGSDRKLWQVRYSGGSWATPRSLGGSVADRPSCYARGADIDCFVRDAGNQMRVRRRVGGIWRAWVNVGGELRSPMSCVYVGTRTRCFGRGTDDALHTVTSNGAAWGSWSSLSGTLSGPPSCLPTGGAGRIACLAPGAAGALLDKRFDGASWGPFVDLGGAARGRPAAVPLGDNRLEVFLRGADSSLRHNSYY